MYIIEVYEREELVSVITVDGELVSFENKADDFVKLPFGVAEKASYQDLVDFYEERCFPRERENAKELLKKLGLDYYEPEEICRKTHGQLWDDFIWLQFSDEPQVRYEDIKLRMG